MKLPPQTYKNRKKSVGVFIVNSKNSSMLHINKRTNCRNCENLRIDNFCLVRGKYILTRNIDKTRECVSFALKEDEQLFSAKYRSEMKKEILELLTQGLNENTGINI